MDEIFGRVQREIQTAGFSGKLNAGIVLTGGGAALEGVSALAADVFGVGVRIGVPGTKLSGLSERVADPGFATASGLGLYGAHRVALSGAGVRRAGRAGASVDKLATRVRNWLQDFF